MSLRFAACLAALGLMACAAPPTADAPAGPGPSTPSAAGGPATGPVAATIVATDFGFTPRRLRVPAGRPVTLRLRNAGTLDHDWLLPAYKVHLHAVPGAEVQVTATFDRAGVFPAACSYPSHAELGMAGALEVGPPDAVAGPADEAAIPATPIPAGVERLPLPTPAPPVGRADARTVSFTLRPQEVDAIVADGVATRLWTYNGTVPGPMLRVRAGDTVRAFLENAITNRESHSVDFHAATGPHGGAQATQVAPGGRAEIRFRLDRPGVYVYHCGAPPAAYHLAHGMYGLVVVEPPEGLPPAAKELYLMQGELYLGGAHGDLGLRAGAWREVAEERPDLVVMNGAVGALAGANATHVEAGGLVRIFFGVGGPNLASSPHMIGETFDRTWIDADPSPRPGISVAAVPPGGAARFELAFEVPGHYPFVDHALARAARGAVAEVHVMGPERPDLFSPGPNTPVGHNHPPGDHKDHDHGEGLHDHGAM